MIEKSEPQRATVTGLNQNPKVKPSFKRLFTHPGDFFRRYKDYRDEKYYAEISAENKDPSRTMIGPIAAWRTGFSSYVIGMLSFIRNIVTVPLIPNLIPSIIPPQQDAFWTLEQVSNWFKATMPNWVIYPFKKLGEGVTWLTQQKSIAAALTYLPYIGLGISSLLSIKDYYYEKNKNIYNSLKLFANLASNILLVVGLAMVQWGSLAAAIYCAPYLIMAAAALVISVGLVRSFHHLYQAYQDPSHRRQHLVNAFKEILCTFINAAGFALALLGVQAAEKLKSFDIKQLNFNVLVDAGELYKKTVILGNAVLAAISTLVLMKVIPALYRGLSFVYHRFSHKNEAHAKPSEAHAPVFIRNEPEISSLVSDIGLKVAKLDRELTSTTDDKAGTKGLSFFSKLLNHRRLEKKQFLTDIKKTLEDHENANPHETLVAIEKKALARKGGIYQSFFKLHGQTEELAARAFTITSSTAT